MNLLFLLFIRFYQFFVSPFLGAQCRFYPSCSVYAETVFNEQPLFKALFLTSKRLLSCHPFHRGGVHVEGLSGNYVGMGR
ncbi:MAG: membrane protein insertion efficiency factor YidD [bacterium]